MSTQALPENPAELLERIRYRGNPVAHPEAVVQCGNARFTFLTARLVRLEWSKDGTFEDRGTYAFPTRYSPTPPPLRIRTEGDETRIDTGALQLRYVKDGGPFTSENLSIAFELNGARVTWTPGTPNPQNLRGTRRTLDECEGDAALDEGMLSRAGWALFDDSASVVFNADDGWVAPRRAQQATDWIFFGYGHDYKEALAEYTQFGGKIPLIPRFVLGAWWSRYWAYSAQDLEDLVGDFARYDLPLDVLVIDMDWHTPHAWTGYTWNRELFPNPPGFLQWVHETGLRATLNLHPAQGVQHFEAIYERFARAMGVDPGGKGAVPFQITNKRFVQHYFELLHHPMEAQGIDFWWIDWQQGESSEMRGLDPLPWLNHLHFNDSTRRGQRPMLYSRWGGLGNHRYHIGFSGDTYVVWTALQFQPYFTATASNVAYGWWSHDIGGHMGGATEPELYARWVQSGALSPCLRLHATKDPLAERRPWKYPDEVYRATRAAFHLRYRLVPYLYTMARVASDTGVPLCRPTYYEHPEKDAAYAARDQYYLGDQMIAAPIVHPADAETGMASTDVWVPSGTWIDYQTKESYAGPRWVRLVGGLDRIPVLVRAAIVPLSSSFSTFSRTGTSAGSTDAIPHDEIAFQVFPGEEGAFRLYEDDGATQNYLQGQYRWTPVRTHLVDEDAWVVDIAPVEGACEALPDERRYAIHLEASRQPQSVTIDGEGTKDWTYNPDTLTTTVRVPARDTHRGVQITAWNPTGISALGTAHNKEIATSDVRRLMGDTWQGDADDVDAVLAAAGPGRADAIARLGGPFVRFVEFTTPEEAALHLGRAIVGGPARADDPYDLRVTFTLFKDGKATEHSTEITTGTGSQILDAPFAFEEPVQAMRWEAAVQITWHGETLTFTHRSRPLFPTIHSWRAVVYNRDETALPLVQVIDEKGTINEALDWQPYVQTAEKLINVNQLHAAMFWRTHRDRLRAGEKLAGYLTTTVISPDDREAVLGFDTRGKARIYVNGQEIEKAGRDTDLLKHPLVEKAQITEPIHLQAGKNTLLIDTQPPEGRPFWAFGAAFITPGETPDLMMDLIYR